MGKDAAPSMCVPLRQAPSVRDFEGDREDPFGPSKEVVTREHGPRVQARKSRGNVKGAVYDAPGERRAAGVQASVLGYVEHVLTQAVMCVILHLSLDMRLALKRA